jgi:transcription elongation factor Elf1
MTNKILMVCFHCDSCGKDFNVSDTIMEQEKNGEYHCIFCGAKGKKIYSYDDYFVKKVK